MGNSHESNPYLSSGVHAKAKEILDRAAPSQPSRLLKWAETSAAKAHAEVLKQRVKDRIAKDKLRKDITK